VVHKSRSSLRCRCTILRTLLTDRFDSIYFSVSAALLPRRCFGRILTPGELDRLSPTRPCEYPFLSERDPAGRCCWIPKMGVSVAPSRKTRFRPSFGISGSKRGFITPYNTDCTPFAPILANDFGIFVGMWVGKGDFLGKALFPEIRRLLGRPGRFFTSPPPSLYIYCHYLSLQHSLIVCN